MLPPQIPTPAERFATILLWLGRVVAGRSAADQLSLALIALIIGRLRDINQRVARLAARIRDGRHAPHRHSAPPRSAIVRRPRRPNPLPQNFGWLLKLVPEAIGYRSQLEYLLGDPEMAALLAAAPASIARPLRSLCWMLRIDPPPILAPPAKPRPPRQAIPVAPETPRPPQQPPLRTSRRKRWSLARICGPPLPA